MQKSGLLLAAGAVAVIACQDPVGPAGPVREFGATADLTVGSACYAVEFVVDYTLTTFVPPFIWQGTVSGDLVGTATLTFASAPTVVTPYTILADGIVDWHVTGGIITELTGGSFQTQTSIVAVSTPDNDPRALNRFQDEALSGVLMANLTGVGQNNAPDFPPMSHVTYRGVICP